MRNKRDLLIVFLPLFFSMILLYIKPYYLIVAIGDPDYHLPRAREILESPLHGLFWDNLRCFPQGKAINHQPLYHLITAGLWYVGGIRFANTVMAILQMALTIGVSSFFSKRYGLVAGFTSGFLAFFSMRPDTLTVPTPSAFLFPLILLTIHFAMEKKEVAYVFLLASLWTHSGALFIFPIIYHFLFSKNESRPLNILLFSFWFFWIFYWMYFGLLRGQMGQQPVAFDASVALTVIKDTLITSLLSRYFLIAAFGAYGLYLSHKNIEAKIILLSTIVIVLFTLLYGDYNRYPQYVIMPLAIFGGITLQRGWDDLLGLVKNKGLAVIPILLIILLLLVNVPNVIMPILDIPIERNRLLQLEFEVPNDELKYFIESNAKDTEIVYADDPLVDKIVWMTGKKVSNCGTYGAPRGYVPQTQKLNLHYIGTTKVPIDEKFVAANKQFFKPIIIEEGVNISVEQMYDILSNNPEAKFEMSTFVITGDMVR